MIPQNVNYLDKAHEKVLSTSRTYKFDPDTGRISGFVEGEQAIMQMIYLTLKTERFDYDIYFDEYGIEFKDLYGEDIQYVLAVIELRIKDALSIDSRILDIQDFEAYDAGHGVVQVKFKCVSTEGTFDYEQDFVLSD